jgi:hypothetical protein
MEVLVMWVIFIIGVFVFTLLGGLIKHYGG